MGRKLARGGGKAGRQVFFSRGQTSRGLSRGQQMRGKKEIRQGTFPSREEGKKEDHQKSKSLQKGRSLGNKKKKNDSFQGRLERHNTSLQKREGGGGGKKENSLDVGERLSVESRRKSRTISDTWRGIADDEPAIEKPKEFRNQVRAIGRARPTRQCKNR